MEFRKTKRNLTENVETIDPYFKFKLLVEELLEIFTKCEDKCGICVEYIVNLCQHIGDIHDRGHEDDNEDISTSLNFIDHLRPTPSHSESESTCIPIRTINSEDVPTYSSNAFKATNVNSFNIKPSVNKNTLVAESFTEDNSYQNIGASHEDVDEGFSVGFTSSEGVQSCTSTSPSNTSPTVENTKAQSDKSGLKQARLKRNSCGICGKNFSHKFYLERHSITHTGEKPFECKTCGKCFTTKQHLKDHNHKHTGEMPYICDICDTSFRYSSNLYRHKLQTKCKTNKPNDNNSNVVLKLHKCLKCGKMFRNRYALNAHSKVHAGEIRRFHCVACGKGFLHNYSLVKHQSTHTGEKQFRCGVCGKHFEYNCLLIRHRLSHMREKKFNCNLCRKGYFYKSHLVRHTLTHTGEKKQHKSFKSSILLKAHKLQSNSGRNNSQIKYSTESPQLTHTGKKLLKCDVCGKSFHDLKVFSAHKIGYKCRRKTSHGMNRKRSIRSQHTCLTCEKTFQSIHDLVRHRVVHSRERINCEMCGKFFLHAGHFKRHMEKHNQ